MNVFRRSAPLAALLALLSADSTFASKTDTSAVTIVVSGETHAMLKPCDCPNDPGGGLAERATVLKKFGDPASLLLLDAGGFSGGGIYDTYSEGRVADSQRTITTLRAMAAMRYDAAAIGDDDLQYGGKWLASAAADAGVPLVSANCFGPGRSSLVSPYRIVVKNGVRIAVTALTTQERLFPLDDSITVAPPFPSLRKLWKEIVAKSDVRIVLSHLGEEMTKTIADSFPECRVIVNGHRKTSQTAVTHLGKTTFMQFGYEGKSLSFAALRITGANHSISVDSSGWLGVGQGIAPDSSIAASIAKPYLPRGAAAFYDLYIMSQCPYGIPALRELVGFVKRFPDVEWNVWFIGSVAGDSLVSLHGAEEVRDEMVWLAVKSLYPDAWLAFLMERSREEATTASAVSRMRFDTVKLKQWIRNKGRQSLSDHYQRSMRLAISASPTLLINNSPFQKDIITGRLAEFQCAAPGARGPFCDSLPECFDDGDCKRKGAIGRCDAPGRCVFIPDAPFTFSVLIADSSIQHPEKSVIETTEDLFPGAAIEIVRAGTEKGRTMLKRFAPAGLPFHHFGSGVAKAYNYSRVESGLQPVAGGFTFKDGVTPRNFFPGRKLVPGSVTVFVDPLFQGASRAIQTITADSLLARRLRIVPVIRSDPDTEAPTIEEKLRREEALRWLVLDSLHPEKFSAYLSAFARDPGSSYWFVELGKLAIAQDAFVRQVRSAGTLIATHWRRLDDLGIRDPVTILLDNRQIVTVRTEADLAGLLEIIKRK